MITDNSEKPSILVIDDKPDEMSSLISLGLNDRATNCALHPQDVDISDLEKADLVLVDYLLDNWPERDILSTISLQPTTGMALTTVLREQVDKNERDRLTAFALHTARLEDIRGRFSPATAQHVFARLNNLEWIFPKSDPKRYRQMISLAEAVRRLPSQWPNDAATMVRRLLAMDKEDESFGRCWQDVKDCRVPIDEMTDRGHGILFIRWMLHEVLPYPCFLWAEHWVAARLGISVDGLREVLAGNSGLAEALKTMRYSGILAGFLGDRWWRGTLEDYVWNLSGGHTADAQLLRDVLTKRAGMDLDLIDASPAVVCVDTDLQPTGQFLSPFNAVTLRSDHWPQFADPAWMDIETVREDPTLLSIVDPLDLHRISRNDG